MSYSLIKSGFFRLTYGITILILYISYPNAVQKPPGHIALVRDSRIPFPEPNVLSSPDDANDIIVHRAGSDAYHFLHDAAIIEHKNILFAAWYNCPRAKMQETALIRGRRSFDTGLTWSAPITVNYQGFDPLAGGLKVKICGQNAGVGSKPGLRTGID